MLNLISNLAFLISIISLGNSNIKLQLVLQSFITLILDVLKSFIKNLVTAKSIDLTSDFSNAYLGKNSDLELRMRLSKFRGRGSAKLVIQMANNRVDFASYVFMLDVINFRRSN